MLFLRFQMGDDRYVIEAARVAEVLPLVHVKHVPRAPAGIRGVINFHGAPVPVVDMCAWALGRAAQSQLSTRLVVVEIDRAAGTHLALMAEQATATVHIPRAAFGASGVATDRARYLGPVATEPDGRLVQWIEIERVLPPEVRDALFQGIAAAP